MAADRTQEQLIGAAQLHAALQGFALAQGKVGQDQLELLALLRARFAKQPSVYKCGTFFDRTFSYNLIGNSLAAVKWLRIGGIGGSTPLVVSVIPIGDANEVDLNVLLAEITTINSSTIARGFYLAYALSPFDATTPMPAEQFCALKVNAISFFNDSALPPNANVYISMGERIPCAGNKYLHVFGLLFNTDVTGFFLSESPTTQGHGSFLTYSLIK